MIGRLMCYRFLSCRAPAKEEVPSLIPIIQYPFQYQLTVTALDIYKKTDTNCSLTEKVDYFESYL